MGDPGLSSTVFGATIPLLLLIVVATALLFDFVNGWNDAANAIATVVGTRVLSPFAAVILAAALNLAGGLYGSKVAKTVATKFVKPEVAVNGATIELDMQIVVLAGMLSAMTWAAWMTVLGLPISGSHSLVGGLVGAGAAAGGVSALIADGVFITLLALLVAPAMGFAVGYLGYVGLIWLTRALRPTTMHRIFGRLQLISASWMGFAHGTNDAQKVMGIITIALLAAGIQKRDPTTGNVEILLWVKVACASAISLGTAVGGWRVIRTLGHHLATLRPTEGFAAETAGASVLMIAAGLGIPTSTTHTITGSIMGVGATRGMSAVRWGVGEKIVLAWIFTLPSTAALAGAIFWVLAAAGVHS